MVSKSFFGEPLLISGIFGVLLALDCHLARFLEDLLTAHRALWFLSCGAKWSGFVRVDVGKVFVLHDVVILHCVEAASPFRSKAQMIGAVPVNFGSPASTLTVLCCSKIAFN